MKNFGTHRFKTLLSIAAVALLSACAQQAAPQEDKDSLESFNRAMFGVHNVIDKAVLRPVATVYRTVVPEKGRDMVGNFLDNLSTPVMAANSFLQLDAENGFANMWRFILNTSFGVGGLFDFASEVGLKSRSTDFGVTLGSYGASCSPYLFVPILGPSCPRDLTGRIVDAFADPFNYYDSGVTLVRGAAVIVDKRSENYKLLDDVYQSSIDPYATLRSAYQQNRAAQVREVTDGKK